MFQRILVAALIAGLAAGLLSGAIQTVKTTPLILAAEAFEEKPAAGHEGHDGWAPAPGLERMLYTFLTSILTGVGLALLLTAALSLKGSAGGWREGMLWGLGGYAAVSLAPAFGLPPELPGMAAADLPARQVWWSATVAGTAAGLALIAFAPQKLLKAAGAVFIVLPHLIGAPHPAEAESAVPAELAAAFVSASLVVNLLFWLTIGGVAGEVYRRLAPDRQPALE